MRTVATQNRHPHLWRGVDPFKCAADLAPHRAIHGVGFVRAVDANVGDVAIHG